MNTLPEDIQDTIYKYKHQIEYCKVMGELMCNVWFASCDCGSDCNWSDDPYDTDSEYYDDSDSDYPVTTL
jgi:hypothetical protein